MTDPDEFFRDIREPGSPMRPLLSVLEALSEDNGARGPLLALKLVKDMLSEDQETRLNAKRELVQRLNTVEALSKGLLSSLAVKGVMQGISGSPMEILAQLPPDEAANLLLSHNAQLRAVFE